MNAIPYDRPEEEWDSYEEGTQEVQDEFALPGRPRRQWFNKKARRCSRSCSPRLASTPACGSRRTSCRTRALPLGRLEPAVARQRVLQRPGGPAPVARPAARPAPPDPEPGSRAPARRAVAGSAACSVAVPAAPAPGATFGTVSSISGDSLYITEASGNTVKVTLSSATKVTKNVTVGKKAVRPGDTVVVAGRRTPMAPSRRQRSATPVRAPRPHRAAVARAVQQQRLFRS